MRVARRVRARGQAAAATATVVVVAATLVFLDRAGPRAPGAAPSGAAPSGAWICPHGGGEGWSASVLLANPGQLAATARVTSLGDGKPGTSEQLAVPPGTTVAVSSEAPSRGSATYVEYFGGWIGAGWVAATGSGAEGLAAEPCAAEASDHWFAPEGSTQLGEDAYVVVTNPFDAPAVLDVAIFSSDRAPVRDSDWTDLEVRPHRSIALHVNEHVKGEPVVATDVEVSVGRVVVASLGVTVGSGLRSALGSTETVAGGIFPEVGGSGQAELIILSVADETIRFGATALSGEPPRPAGGLTEQEQEPRAARAYAVPVDRGPAAVRLFTLDGGRVVGALRVLGPGEDPGATGGAVAPAASWVVLPAVAAGSAETALVLVNDGDEDVTATLEILPQGGGAAAAPVTVEVPAHATAAAPPEFLASAPAAAVLVRAEGGTLVAMSSSSARLPGGAARFALALGVPLPPSP